MFFQLLSTIGVNRVAKVMHSAYLCLVIYLPILVD